MSRGGARRRAGGAFLVAGGALLLLGAADWSEGAVARSRAREAWAEVEARRAVAAAHATADGATGSATRALGRPIGRLLVPSIGLDEVIVEGVGRRELNAGPGHVPATVLPGEAGNAAVSAHRDRHFSRFGRVTLGDTIVTETVDRRITWRVVATRIVDKDAPAIYPTREPTLTLTTCWPIRWFGPAPRRLVVTAKPIEPR